VPTASRVQGCASFLLQRVGCLAGSGGTLPRSRPAPLFISLSASSHISSWCCSGGGYCSEATDYVMGLQAEGVYVTTDMVGDAQGTALLRVCCRQRMSWRPHVPHVVPAATPWFVVNCLALALLCGPFLAATSLCAPSWPHALHLCCVLLSTYSTVTPTRKSTPAACPSPSRPP
jgi:hypothetical protein